MSQTPTTQIRRGAAVAAALSVAAMLWLTGCGGSSKSSGQNAGSQGPSAAAHPGTSTGGNSNKGKAAEVSPVRLAAARVGVISLSGCMRKEGIKLPPQRLSGPNPNYNPGGINTHTPQYEHAMHICLPKAIAAFNKRLKKH